MIAWSGVLLGAALAAACVTAQAAEPTGRVTTWPAPPGEKLFDDFTVRVDGKLAPVYACRVSAVPLNQVWPGYQRPMDQTEMAGFAAWEMSGPVTVEVTAKRAFTSVAVRPTSRGIKPKVEGRRITFRLTKPGQLTVELDGFHGALHLFADAPKRDAPKADSPNVRYFGPGVHRPGKLELRSGETVYVAGGAVVYTSIQAHGASNVRILGRGIVDTSEYERDKGGGCIRLTDCSGVQVDGVILRDPDVWCLSAFGCRDLAISSVKLVGLWRYNADGIDICNSQNVTIRCSFVRSFDDAIVLKGLRWDGGYDERPVRDIRVSGMVLWCDWGRALEIGAETSAPEFTDIQFSDCDVIRTTHIAMDLQCGDRALVHDVRFENIRVECDDRAPAPKMQATREEIYRDASNCTYVPNLLVIVIAANAYSKDQERGRVRDILFKDITVLGSLTPTSWFRGLDAEHTVEGVRIEDLRFGGRVASDAASAHLDIGPFVKDVHVEAAKG